MLARVAGVALVVGAIANQVIAYDDDALFSGWTKDDAFSSVVAERLSAAVAVPTPSTIAMVPSVPVAAPVLSIDAFTGRAQVVPRVRRRDPHHIKIIKATAHAKADAVRTAEKNLRDVNKAIVKNDAAIKNVEKAQAVNGTSAELEKQLIDLKTKSKELAKKLLDAKMDVAKTTAAAKEAAEKAFAELTKKEQEERAARLKRRAEAKAARMKRRAEAKAARINAHNEAVKQIQGAFDESKAAVEKKYAESNKADNASLADVRKRIKELKVQIAQKKAEELRAERRRLRKQLKAAEDQVKKFTAKLNKLGLVSAPRRRRGVAGQHVVMPVAPGVDMALETSPYRPVAISPLPAKLASIATVTNPKKAFKIAKITRENTADKAGKLANVVRSAKKAQVKAAKTAFKAAVLRQKAVEAQHDYAQATATENSVQHAIRNTVANVVANNAPPAQYVQVTYSH